ncbi:hypothetical protein TSAR_015328 [Trichomalopsis sarcophagae]|uniref:Odorant receptor n=1 Tax=Trichomalopsis sarcophagae TaxID=543379 RepID=A0A232EFG8_9HYME|nr:hypothetical protein TSAR_015328 [Trichomalopsis sarcophagae]
MKSTTEASGIMRQYDDCIFLNRLGLTIVGIWPLEQNASRLRIVLRRIHLGAIYVLMLSVVIPQWFDIYCLWGNIDANTETFMSNVFMIAVMIKISNFLNSMRLFEDVLRTMRLNWLDVMRLSSGELEKKQIMQGLSMKARNRGTIYGLVVVMTGAMYGLMPLIGSNKVASLRDRSYPFFGKYFFDRNSDTVYTLCYLSQLMSGSVTAVANFATDAIFLVCVYHFCAQLRILQTDLIKLGAPRFDSREALAQLIRRHQKEIRNVRALQSLFSISSLQQLFLSCLMICLNGFKLIVSLCNRELDILMYIVCLPVTLFQILFYCQPGNELIVQSQSLDEAIQQSYWVNLDRLSKRNLLFVIQRSQKPLAITAGKIYVLSLENFMRASCRFV